MRVRTVWVPSRRVHRWVAGFAERHGGVVDTVGTPAGLRLTAADGAFAELTPVLVPNAPEPGGPTDPLLGSVGARPGLTDLVTALVERVESAEPVGVLLVRRGGYAVASIHRDRVVSAAVGTRYVQGRTAAGGWSQQRFARRRENQTAGLVRSAVAAAQRILVPPGRTEGPPLRWLVTGGDRVLVDRALADPRLASLGRLLRGPHLDVGNPRQAVVRALPERLSSVTVLVGDPDPGSDPDPDRPGHPTP